MRKLDTHSMKIGLYPTVKILGATYLMVHDGVLLGERVVLELLLVVLDHAEKVVVCVVGVHLDGLLLLLHDLLLLGAPLLAVLLQPLHLLHHVRPSPV